MQQFYYERWELGAAPRDRFNLMRQKDTLALQPEADIHHGRDLFYRQVMVHGADWSESLSPDPSGRRL